jgi:hypothetical protein
MVMYNRCKENIRRDKMIRTQICLTENEKTRLEEESKQIGISMAELIRRILDRYLEKKQS